MFLSVRNENLSEKEGVVVSFPTQEIQLQWDKIIDKITNEVIQSHLCPSTHSHLPWGIVKGVIGIVML